MTATARPIAAPPAQLDLFRGLIKLRTRDVLTVNEVAEITRLSRQSVELLLEEGRLAGFGFRLGGTKEKQKRITAESLCRYLVESSNVADEDLAELLLTWLSKLDARTTDFVLTHATAHRAHLARHRLP